MKYITDIIGDEYLNWQPGGSVLIATPTGSGKSTFVLKKLLPHAAAQGKVLLYLCNRKMLGAQFTETTERELDALFADVGGIPDNMRQAIYIVTYQHCEVCGRFPDLYIPPDLSGYSREQKALMQRHHSLPEGTRIPASDIFYCVFDEAHYLLTDSQFNQRSSFWFNADFGRGCTNVFLTATPDPFLTFMAARHPKFRIDEQIREIKKVYDKRARLRKELETPSSVSRVDLQRGGTLRNDPMLPKRKIDEQCRNIQPYEACIQDLETFRSTLRIRRYDAADTLSSYADMETKYFRELDELMPLLLSAAPQDKWLLLVDDKERARHLSGRLTQAGITAALLTADSIKRPGAAREEFLRIARSGQFASSVLLATSVMDCGVSITDACLKHIVIAHHNKTTFLQMLGRKRLHDGEQVHLYVKAYTAKTINGVRNALDKKLRFLTEVALFNSVDYVQAYQPTRNSDGMVTRPVLSRREKEKIRQAMLDPHNVALLYDRHNRPLYAKQNNVSLELPEYSPSAYISLLFDISEYQTAMDSYHRTNDDLFYLKRQLSWIGKEYSEENWLGGPEARERLLAYLSEMEGVWMDGSEQAVFRDCCLELFEALPVPPSAWKGAVCRYRSGKQQIGLQKLKKAFQEKAIPFQIVAKQRMVGGERETFWKLEKTE